MPTETEQAHYKSGYEKGYSKGWADGNQAHRQWIPPIVCLCGSTKNKEQFEAVNKQETLNGKIVLSVGFFGHQEAKPIPPEIKEKLDNLHKCKIDLANEVVVIVVDNYVGESTLSEIEYAASKNKTIRYARYFSGTPVKK